MYPNFTHVSQNKLSLMSKNENFPCFVLTCSPKRVVCGPAGREHGGKHSGVSVPDGDAAGLARYCLNNHLNNNYSKFFMLYPNMRSDTSLSNHFYNHTRYNCSRSAAHTCDPLCITPLPCIILTCRPILP